MKFSIKDFFSKFDQIRRIKVIFLRTIKVIFQLTDKLSLTHFMLLVFFDTPRKYQRNNDFLIFSGGIERDQWHEMTQYDYRN